MSERTYIFLPTGVKFYLDLEDLDGEDTFVEFEVKPADRQETYYVKRFLSALQETLGTTC